MSGVLLFLLQNRKVPSTLIDESSRLVDLLKRIKFVPETACRNIQVDSTLTLTKRKLSPAPVEPSTAEKDCPVKEEELSRNGNRNQPSTPDENDGFQPQKVVRADPSCVAKNYHEESESDQNVEIDEDDDEVVILDDDDNHDEVLVVENEDNENNEEESNDEDGDDGGEHSCDSNAHLSDDVDEKYKYSDDDEDVIYDVDGNLHLEEEENKVCDVEFDSYHGEEETEILNENEGEVTCVQEEYIGSDYDNDDRYGQTEDEKRRMVGQCGKMNNDSYRENEKYRSDDCDNDIDEELEDSDDFIGSAEDDDCDDDCDDSDRFDGSMNVKSCVGSFGLDHSNTSQRADIPSDNHKINRVVGVDIYENTADSEASPENNSAQNNESLSVKSDRDVVETEKGQLSEFPPSFEAVIDECERKNNVANKYDATDTEHIHIQKAHKVRTEVAAVRGEFGDTTEEEDGNDRFRANRTAQADRLADHLRSGVGYASQVEDGYEPEDTHEYTEEEVSEAIHSEDEEDECILKQNSRLSDIDTTQQQAGHASESATRLLSGKSRDIVRNTDRQNSVEFTSDDMDMADERTEQEEDVAAEFSELEENPGCSFESKKMPPSQSTQAKSLLEFAQKAQNKDNWIDNLKDTETYYEDVDSKRNDIQEVGQIDAEDRLLPQETEFNKIVPLSFDADDEKYATEGCKSLETEEEEDIEKESRVDIFLNEGVSTTNDNNDDQENEFKIGYDDKSIGLVESAPDKTQGKSLNESQELVSVENDRDEIDNEDAEVFVNYEDNDSIADEDCGDAVSDINTKEITLPKKIPGGTSDKREIVSQVRKAELEVRDLVKNDDCSKLDDFVGDKVKTNEDVSHLGKCEEYCRGKKKDISNTKEVLPRERSTEIGNNEDGDAVDGSRNDKVADDEARVNRKSDDFDVNFNAKASAVAESEKAALLGENNNLLSRINDINDHDSEYALNEKIAPGLEDGDINSDDAASGDYGGNFNNDTGTVAVDLKDDQNDVTHFDAEARLEVSNADDGTGESSYNSSERSMSMDEVCTEDIPSLSHDEALSYADNPQPQIQDNITSSDDSEDQKSKTDDEVIIDETDSRVEDERRTGTDERRSNEDDCNNSTIVVDAKPEGIAVEDTEVIDASKAKSNAEYTDLQSIEKQCVDQTVELADSNVAVGIKQFKANMDAENELDAIDGSNGDIKNRKSARLGPNQAHMQGDKAVDTNTLMNEMGFSVLPTYNEEELEINDSVEDESSDIPQFIGGDMEQELSTSTRRFGRKKSKRHADEETSVSSSSTRKPLKQASTRNSEGIADNFGKINEDEDSIGDESVRNGDRGSVISEIFRKYGSKKSKRQTDDERSVSSSSSLGALKEVPTRTYKGTAGTLERTEGDEDSVGDESVDNGDGGSVISEISVSQPSEHVEEPSIIALTTSGSNRGCKNSEDKDSSAFVMKKRKARVGLPPRPPKETIKEPRRRNARLKKENDDELSVQTRTSTRSTRSTNKKLSSGARASKKKGKEIENDDGMSIQSVRSTRSTRSTTRKLPSGARASKQKGKEIENYDDMSIQTTTSTRSTTRKMTSRSISPKQKDKEVENDDDVSVQTITSTRSTRNAAKKLSSGARSPKHKGKKVESDDDVSVRTRTSTRSTGSKTRKPSSSSEAPEQTGKEVEDNDDVSVQTRTSTRSTGSANRKLSSGSRAPKQKGKQIEKDDDVSVQTRASTRSTGSATRKLSSGARAPKQKGKQIENDDDASVQTRASTRSTGSSTRKLSSGARAPKRKGEEIAVQTRISTRSTRRMIKETAEDNNPFSQWTVKMLQVELKKRKILYSTKLRKKDLIEILESTNEGKKHKNPI